MPTQDWKTKDSQTRLLAALVASLGPSFKLDYRKIAELFGQGAGYNSIEAQFRSVRKEAEELRRKVETGEHAAVPPRNRNVRGNGATRVRKEQNRAVRQAATAHSNYSLGEDDLSVGSSLDMTSPSSASSLPYNQHIYGQQIGSSRNNCINLVEDDSSSATHLRAEPGYLTKASRKSKPRNSGLSMNATISGRITKSKSKSKSISPGDNFDENTFGGYGETRTDILLDPQLFDEYSYNCGDENNGGFDYGSFTA